MLARDMSTNDPDLPVPAGAAARPVWRWRGGRIETARDLVADEVPIALEYNGVPFVVMMATPGDLDDFALGFSLGEGIVERPGEVSVAAIDHGIDGIVVRMHVPAHVAEALSMRRRNLQGRSGCGICGSESIEAVLRFPGPMAPRLRTDATAVARAMARLRDRQALNAVTGATHAAGWAAPDGTVMVVREDVGRHNALDKLIGALHRSGIDPGTGFAVITSRASYEMVLKAARAGIELLAAISAPTSLAIALADSAGQTLLGFVRDADHVAYTHTGRLHPSVNAERVS